MSRFYAEIQGGGVPSSRTGSEKSGIVGHIRGWDIGAKVTMAVDEDGEDVLSIDITGGSNSTKALKHLCVITRKELDGGRKNEYNAKKKPKRRIELNDE